MDEDRRIQYQRSLDHWSRRFDQLMASKAKVSPSERRTIALLRLHKRSISINLINVAKGIGAAARDVMMWDNFIDEYKAMLHDAAIALGLDKDEDEGSWPLDASAVVTAAPQFHLEFGIITAILTVIVKCRDPLIRRQAVSLMLAVPSQEGIWSSTLLARVTKRLIALEEGGREVHSCHDIPQHARIRELVAAVGPGQTSAKIQFVFVYGTVEELISWE